MGKTNHKLSKKCAKCNQVRFKDLPRNRYFALSSDESVRIANLINPSKVLEINDLICNNCYNKAFNLFNKQADTNLASHSPSSENLVSSSGSSSINIENEVLDNTTINEVDAIHSNDTTAQDLESPKRTTPQRLQTVESEFLYVDLPKSFSTHKYCVICRKNFFKLHIIQSDARTQVLLAKNIYIPKGCRTCRSHLNEAGLFKTEDLDLIEIAENQSKINRESANELIQTLIEASKKNSLFDEFADPCKVDSQTCKLTTGFNKEE